MASSRVTAARSRPASRPKSTTAKKNSPLVIVFLFEAASTVMNTNYQALFPELFHTLLTVASAAFIWWLNVLMYNFMLPTANTWGFTVAMAVPADYDPTRDYHTEMVPPGSATRATSGVCSRRQQSTC